jgi:hypothetical protein
MPELQLSPYGEIPYSEPAQMNAVMEKRSLKRLSVKPKRRLDMLIPVGERILPKIIHGLCPHQDQIGSICLKIPFESQ